MEEQLVKLGGSQTCPKCKTLQVTGLNLPEECPECRTRIMKNCDICGAPNGNHVFPCRIVKKADQVANTEGSLRGSDLNETTGNKSASVMVYKDLASKIVEAIIDDLTDRRGLKHEYNQCDPDIQEEIKDTWRQIAEDEMEKSL